MPSVTSAGPLPCAASTPLIHQENNLETRTEREGRGVVKTLTDDGAPDAQARAEAARTRRLTHPATRSP
jgi:hypothetical protein